MQFLIVQFLVDIMVSFFSQQHLAIGGLLVDTSLQLNEDIVIFLSITWRKSIISKGQV